jgi:hypothetical protein
LAEITSAQLLREAFCGVSWLFFMVEDLKLGFGLIILGEVENLQFVYVMNACGNFTCFMLKIMKLLA